MTHNINVIVTVLNMFRQTPISKNGIVHTVKKFVCNEQGMHAKQFLHLEIY